jgi:hypothetical protein
MGVATVSTKYVVKGDILRRMGQSMEDGYWGAGSHYFARKYTTGTQDLTVTTFYFAAHTPTALNGFMLFGVYSHDAVNDLPEDLLTTELDIEVPAQNADHAILCSHAFSYTFSANTTYWLACIMLNTNLSVLKNTGAANISTRQAESGYALPDPWGNTPDRGDLDPMWWFDGGGVDAEPWEFAKTKYAGSVTFDTVSSPLKDGNFAYSATKDSGEEFLMIQYPEPKLALIYPDIYFSWNLYFPTGYTHSGTSSAYAIVRILSLFLESEMVAFQTYRADEGPPFGEEPPQHLRIVYTEDTGQGAENFLNVMRYDQWMRFEIYCKQQSADNAGDGILRFWIDGHLKFEKTDMEWAEHAISAMMIGFGHYITFPDNTFYFDKIQIDTSYIGPAPSGPSQEEAAAAAAVSGGLIEGSWFGLLHPRDED